MRTQGDALALIMKIQEETATFPCTLFDSWVSKGLIKDIAGVLSPGEAKKRYMHAMCIESTDFVHHMAVNGEDVTGIREVTMHWKAKEFVTVTAVMNDIGDEKLITNQGKLFVILGGKKYRVMEEVENGSIGDGGVVESTSLPGDRGEEKVGSEVRMCPPGN